MRRITVDERRARLGRRHRLATDDRGHEVTEVARAVVALHSTDPATVHLAAAARMMDPRVDAIEQALYQDRTLVRMLAMRRTMWVVPREHVAMVESACTKAIAVRERRRLIKLLEDTEIAPAGEGRAWLETVEQATLAALENRGAASGSELSADVPALRSQFSYGEGKSYASTQTVTTQILNGLSMAGRIVRGRPRGTWNSSQYRWAPMDAWLPGGLADLDRTEAQTALVHAWLRSFGPGTIGDLKWWTGLNLGDVRQALDRLEVVEIDLEGLVGLVLADDLEPMDPPAPWVALLPALDPTAMGWTARDWYLGAYRQPLFDRSGNIGPTVWCDGRIVGGWAQRKDGTSGGEIAFRLFEDIGRETTSAVEAAAARLASCIGTVKVTPRFRTPLERELAG